MYYSFLGCFITVFLGWIVSYLIGTTETDLYDEHLLHPLALRISRWFPGAPRHYAAKATDTNANKAKKTIPTVSFGIETASSDMSDPPYGIYKTKL